MIKFEELEITGNGVLTTEKWNDLLKNTKSYLNGNVGLGIDTPESKLQIKGKGGMNVDLIVNGRIRSESSHGGLWVANDRFVGGLAPDKIGIYNNRAWRLIVLKNGNVGIATKTPTAKLHVKGSLTCGTLKAGITQVSKIKGVSANFVMLNSHAMVIGDSLKAKRAEIASLRVSTINAKRLKNIGNKRNVQYNSTTGEIGFDNSTRRDKRNITPLFDDFGKIMQLQPRKYTRPFDKENWEIGYLAEEAKSLGLHNLVFHDEDNNPDGINYRKLCLYLVEIVREHERKLNPNSPHLEKYIEEELPKPNLKSNKENIKVYLSYHRISYRQKDTKEELLKKIESLDKL